MSCVDARFVIDIGMSLSHADLPHDPHDLRRVAGDLQRDVAALSAEVHAKTLLIEKLKMQLAVLRRARFGRSSEKLDSAVEQQSCSSKLTVSRVALRGRSFMPHSTILSDCDNRRISAILAVASWLISFYLITFIMFAKNSNLQLIQMIIFR